MLSPAEQLCDVVRVRWAPPVARHCYFGTWNHRFCSIGLNWRGKRGTRTARLKCWHSMMFSRCWVVTYHFHPLQLGRHVSSKPPRNHMLHVTAVYLIRHSFREAAMRPFKLWLSIYTIYKVLKFNSAQQFHLIFVSTHIKQMPWGAFATLEISKKTRSRLVTHGICSHLKCMMVYSGGGCNPYLSIFSKWTHCFWSHAFWKCLHS